MYRFSPTHSTFYRPFSPQMMGGVDGVGLVQAGEIIQLSEVDNQMSSTRFHISSTGELVKVDSHAALPDGVELVEEGGLPHGVELIEEADLPEGVELVEGELPEGVELVEGGEPHIF